MDMTNTDMGATEGIATAMEVGAGGYRRAAEGATLAAAALGVRKPF